jgi:hypothetical protein
MFPPDFSNKTTFYVTKFMANRQGVVFQLLFAGGGLSLGDSVAIEAYSLPL